MLTRLAMPDDAPAIAETHVRSWQQAYRSLLPQEFLDGLDPTRWAEQWRLIIGDQSPPADATVVGCEGEAVLGFAHVCPSRDFDARAELVGELSSIYLRPDTWGRGAGRQLISHARSLLLEAGYAEATLWVLAANARAIRFYQADGWTPDGTGRHETLAGVAVDEVRYRTAL